MKKLLFCFFFLWRFSQAQSIDDPVIKQLQNDKRIIGVHYAQILFKNGKVKEEGWEYKKINNRNDGKYWAKQYDKFPVIAYRIGEWKEYYHRGKLKALIYYPLEDDSIHNEKRYNRKGELIYEFYYPGTEEYEYKLTESGRRRKLKNFKKYEYRKGKLWLEENYKNGKKDGIWREYDKEGTMIFETEYINGKKVKKEKTKTKF